MLGQRIIDRYQVLQSLRLGNITNTYLAIDLAASDRPQCIVKQLVLDHIEPKLLAARKRLFAQEVVSLQTLDSHPQIPKYLNHFEHQSDGYLVQEFIEGHSLATEFVAGSRWQEPHIIQFLKEILSLLVFVHSRGVIHRDIKPSNILYRESDHRPVLIDFGVARHLPTERSHKPNPLRTHFIVGTPGYMAIEQASRRSRPNSDIYSLGLIAIQALTGRSPRQLPENENGEYLWRQYAEVSEDLAAVLSKMVRYHYTQRFQSAAEALAMLNKVTSDERMGPGISKKRGVFGQRKVAVVHR